MVEQVDEDELAGGGESVALGAGHRFFLLGLVPCVAGALGPEARLCGGAARCSGQGVRRRSSV
jgi:hypothetical protein